MANSFDIASFNLINWANSVVDLYDSTPKDVEIVQKDNNGNLFTKAIANRGKFKQQLWDDVGGALGQFSRTFYVDAENGDDNNTGDSSHPFKTIKKACDSVPVGGNANIYLTNYAEYVVNEDILVNNKSIEFFTNDKKGDGSHSVIVFQWYVNDDNNTNNLYSFQAISSHRSGYYNLGFHSIDLKEDTTNYDSNNNDNAKYMFRSSYDGSATSRNITFYNCNITLTHSICIAPAYETGNKYYYSSGGILCATANKCSITTNSNYFMKVNNSSGVLNSYDSSIDNDNYWCSGIVKDSNGVPRNIVSNIIF